MYNSFTCITLYSIVTSICITVCMLTGYSEGVHTIITDTLPKKQLPVSLFPANDTSHHFTDSIGSSVKKILNQQLQGVKNKFRKPFADTTVRKQLLSHIKADTIFKNTFQHTLKGLLKPRPLLQFTGGMVSYNFDYRSNIDTPFLEKNIAQHQLLSSLNMTVAGSLPFRVNAFIRKSNSAVFRDINDVQVIFDAAAFRNMVSSGLRNRLLSEANKLKDTLAGMLMDHNLAEAKKLSNWLTGSMSMQKLVDANEIIKTPGITDDKSLPDSVNRKRADSLQYLAKLFLETYNQTKHQYDSLQILGDSLKKVYESSIGKMLAFRQLLNKEPNNPGSYRQWAKEVDAYSEGASVIPAKYRWLMGIRSFALGRNTVNSSELTAKNISLNGVNFEYNSWYYVALTAGTVDYRFRDFIVNRSSRSPQYMYQARLGIGRLESNHFIVSFYQGQKQLFASSSSPGKITTVKVTGYSAESRWQLNRSSYVTVEAAQSLSPDFNSNPATLKSGWDFSDKTNKALAVKVYSWLPKTASRLEGQYKYTGANFQSFSSFQTNAELKAWYLKAEQNFLHRKLKIVASLRSNEFSNPYIIQNYKANTVFKSLSATWRSRKFPIISISYMPMSQLTMLGTQLAESRFQTFNASVSHFYKIGTSRESTSLVFSKFYNNSNDSGFIYYNSSNVFLSQSFFFKRFAATINISNSRNSNYEYTVMDEGINLPYSKWGTIGGGVKINNLNRQSTKTGGYVNGSIRLNRNDVLYFHVENNFLPGNGNQLVQNLMGNIGFTKAFR